MTVEAVLVHLRAVGWKTCLNTCTPTDEVAPYQQYCAGEDPNNSMISLHKKVLSIAAYVMMLLFFS